MFLTNLCTSGFRGRWPAKTTTGSRETLENPPTGKLLKEKNLKLARSGGHLGGQLTRATDPETWEALGSPLGGAAGGTADTGNRH